MSEYAFCSTAQSWHFSENVSANRFAFPAASRTQPSLLSRSARIEHTAPLCYAARVGSIYSTMPSSRGEYLLACASRVEQTCQILQGGLCCTRLELPLLCPSLPFPPFGARRLREVFYSDFLDFGENCGANQKSSIFSTKSQKSDPMPPKWSILIVLGTSFGINCFYISQFPENS